MAQSTPTISPAVFGLFDAVSLLSSVASLVLAVLAIWLTLRFKKDADDVNRHTMEVLTDIRSDAKAITQGVMAELRAYGESMRGTIERNVMTAPRVASPPSPER